MSAQNNVVGEIKVYTPPVNGANPLPSIGTNAIISIEPLATVPNIGFAPSGSSDYVTIAVDGAQGSRRLSVLGTPVNDLAVTTILMSVTEDVRAGNTWNGSSWVTSGTNWSRFFVQSTGVVVMPQNSTKSALMMDNAGNVGEFTIPVNSLLGAGPGGVGYQSFVAATGPTNLVINSANGTISVVGSPDLEEINFINADDTATLFGDAAIYPISHTATSSGNQIVANFGVPTTGDPTRNYSVVTMRVMATRKNAAPGGEYGSSTQTFNLKLSSPTASNLFGNSASFASDGPPNNLGDPSVTVSINGSSPGCNIELYCTLGIGDQWKALVEFVNIA